MGIALGVLAAVMRQSANPVMSGVGWFYVWFFRGTPVLVQLLLWFNLSLVFQTFTIPGIWRWTTNTFMTPFVAALLGLGINEGAYMAEIVRAGIGSVDEGQTEAAQALGMTAGPVAAPDRAAAGDAGDHPADRQRVHQHAQRPASLAYAITYPELLRSASDIYTNNLQIIELLFAAAAWYLLLTSVFSIGQYYLERRFARGSSRSLPADPCSGCSGASRIRDGHRR